MNDRSVMARVSLSGMLKNKFLVIVLLAALFGCASPAVPPEVKLAEEQEHRLWTLGAKVYAPADYEGYLNALRRTKEALIQEESRFAWFRDYRDVQSGFRDVLKTGYGLQEKILSRKRQQRERILGQIAGLQKQMEALKGLSERINEGRFARKDLSRAELLLSEAMSRCEREDYAAADDQIKRISDFISAAEDSIRPIFDRYADRSHIKKWKRMADETIAESQERDILAMVVNKSRRALLLYKSGVLVKTYQVGLGSNGSLDKLRAGDNSTPEGKYKVIKKNASSRYHKALLINYPNEDDRRDFIQAKKKGLIPARSRIGGLIEIHGGGKDSMTFGCIAMDNHAIDDLFHRIPVGTPVTIVGAVDHDNSLSSAVKGS